MPDPVIAAAGDIACAPGDAVTATTCHQAAVSDLLVDTGLSAVLPLGDNQYASGDLSDFRASYAPTWGRVDAMAHPVPGNREYATGNARGYFAYFGARAGPAPGGYYSYDVGSWHLVALNSNCRAVACGAGSAQETWLRSDLAAHPARCSLAYWHAPLFNSGRVGRALAMKVIWQDLQAAGVDIVLSGHDHHYERFAPQDAAGVANSAAPREFIVGTGGASHAALPTSTAPNSEVSDYDTFGVLRLTLHPTGYDWRFAPEAGRTFSDAGSRPCR